MLSAVSPAAADVSLTAKWVADMVRLPIFPEGRAKDSL
jgi:hypothetical protein